MSQKTQQTIVDICLPLFRWVKEGEKTDIFETKCVVSKLLMDIEQAMKQTEIKDSVWQETKFVLCAFVDEMILKNSGDFSQSWSRETLQLQYYKEQVAGERFFERLSYLQQFSDRRYDLMMLYYWCLSLGFEGKYTEHELTDIRRGLRSDLELHYIQRQRKKIEEGLTAAGMEVDAQVTKGRTLPFRWVMASFIAGIGLVYGAHYWMVASMVRQIKGSLL